MLGQPRLRVGDLGQALLPGPLGGGDRGRQPPGLIAGSPGPAGQRAQLARRLGGRGIGLVQPRECVGQRLPGLLFVLDRGGELALRPLALALRVAELALGLPGRRLQAEYALLGRGAALGPVRAKHVAVPRDDPQRGIRAHQLEPGAQVSAHQDVTEQRRDRAREFRRRGDQVNRAGNGAVPAHGRQVGARCPRQVTR